MKYDSTRSTGGGKSSISPQSRNLGLFSKMSSWRDFFTGDDSTPDLEFRLFFPVDPHTESNNAELYRESYSSMLGYFTNLDGVGKEDMHIETEMIYLVGSDHWGAKYRGEKRKLEVKFRKDVYSLGDAIGVIERWKKKKFDKHGNDIQRNKELLLEKVKKFCTTQQTEQEDVLLNKAVDTNRLMKMVKRRRSFLQLGAMTELAFLDVYPCVHSLEAAITQDKRNTSALDMLNIKQEHEKEKAEGLVASTDVSNNEIDGQTKESSQNTSNMPTEWVSVAIEGKYENILQTFSMEHSAVIDTMKAALQCNVPVIVGGYPTFVRMSDATDMIQVWSAQNRECVEKIVSHFDMLRSERIAKATGIEMKTESGESVDLVSGGSADMLGPNLHLGSSSGSLGSGAVAHLAESKSGEKE